MNEKSAYNGIDPRNFAPWLREKNENIIINFCKCISEDKDTRENENIISSLYYAVLIDMFWNDDLDPKSIDSRHQYLIENGIAGYYILKNKNAQISLQDLLNEYYMRDAIKPVYTRFIAMFLNSILHITIIHMRLEFCKLP